MALEKQYNLLFAHFPNLSVMPVDNEVAERAASALFRLTGRLAILCYYQAEHSFQISIELTVTRPPVEKTSIWMLPGSGYILLVITVR